MRLYMLYSCMHEDSNQIGSISCMYARFRQIEEETLLKKALVLPAFEPHRQGSLGMSIADEASKGKFHSNMASLIGMSAFLHASFFEYLEFIYESRFFKTPDDRQPRFCLTVTHTFYPARKEGIQEMFNEKRILQFKLKVFPRGHTPTNYSKWFESMKSYQVQDNVLII